MEFSRLLSPHVQVLKEYWKEWKLYKATYMNPAYVNPVKFMFSNDDKKVQGMLSAESGEGWKASLPVTDMVRGLEWCRKVVVWPSVICDLSYDHSCRHVVMRLLMAVAKATKRNWKVKWKGKSTLRLFPLS